MCVGNRKALTTRGTMGRCVVVDSSCKTHTNTHTDTNIPQVNPLNLTFNITNVMSLLLSSYPTGLP